MIKELADERRTLILQYKENPSLSVKQTLARLLTDTAALQDFVVLGDDELYHQALAVHDAFDAVSNGMFAPAAFDALQAITDDHLFIYWKQLILAINAMYEGNLPQAVNLCEQINSDVPQYRFLSLFKKLAGEEITLDGSMQKLYHRLTADNKILDVINLAISDALESEQSTIFFETINLYVQELEKSQLALAQALALWAFRIALDREWDERPAADILSRLYEKDEKLRALALATIDYDNAFSLNAFMGFLNIYFTQPRQALDVRVALKILGEIALLAETESCPESEFTYNWRNLQALFYRHQEHHHLLWPQEESLYNESRLLVYGSLEKLPPQPEKPQNKQLELF